MPGAWKIQAAPTSLASQNKSTSKVLWRKRPDQISETLPKRKPRKLHNNAKGSVRQSANHVPDRKASKTAASCCTLILPNRPRRNKTPLPKAHAMSYKMRAQRKPIVAKPRGIFPALAVRCSHAATNDPSPTPKGCSGDSTVKCKSPAVAGPQAAAGLGQISWRASSKGVSITGISVKMRSTCIEMSSGLL